MGLFRRDKTAVAVRVLATGPMKAGYRQIGFRRRERRREVQLEVRYLDGSTHQVDKKMWVPEWVGIEQLAKGGRLLRGEAPADDPSAVKVDWDQIEAPDAISQAEFVTLFHKTGSPEERLAIVEALNAQGQFKEELYERARGDLLREIEGPSPH